ncbi:MAG TPA: hypothetical protein VK119_00310 [Bacillota bacterium]|nr:hypothetical protein [Bacillota bacterium]
MAQLIKLEDNRSRYEWNLFHNLLVIKTVVSRVNPTIFTEESYQSQLMRKYDEWLKEKRPLTLPLKRHQLKAAEQLLHYCQTISVRIPEWQDDLHVSSREDRES